MTTDARPMKQADVGPARGRVRSRPLLLPRTRRPSRFASPRRGLRVKLQESDSRQHEEDGLVLLLLLLSRDLPSGGRDLPLQAPSPEGDPLFEQLVLPGVEAPLKRARSQTSRQTGRIPTPALTVDPLMEAYERRLAAQGGARKGASAYHYHLRSMLKIAARQAGRPVTCIDLFRDERLLGHVLVDDIAPTLGRQVSKWTLAPRRSALRSFARLMRPELLPALGEDPHERLTRALRAVAERVGGGYRLTGGAPRRRGGRAPSEREVRAVIEAVSVRPGYRGARNRAFFLILAETGCRVTALRTLDGTNCLEMPSGRLRLFLYEKGKAEPREVELSRSAVAALREYEAAFNLMAAIRRWTVRIQFGHPGAIWRNSGRGCWSEADVRHTLRDGCTSARVPALTPHAFRRAFATDAASVLPRHTVARAGGWQGLERLDDHYVQPRAEIIAAKLNRARHPVTEHQTDPEAPHEAALLPRQ